VIFALILASLAFFNAPTIASQPGDADDPLVTRNYVDNRIAQLQIEIAMLRNALDGVNPNAVYEIPQTTQPAQPVVAAERDIFQVINMLAGQIITFEASAEFILRGGSASAVTGVNGIIDITSGVDVLNGENIELHHMMMVPVTDGRGVRFNTESWIMVRGGYTIVY
jgi:hypothetical protein